MKCKSSRLLPCMFLFCLLSCFRSSAQDARQQDYRPKIQSLSQQMHETLDESNQQSRLLMEQYEAAMSDLKLSEERVSALETQVRDLTSSSLSMSQKLSESSTKLIISEANCKREKKAKLVVMAILAAENIMRVAFFVIKTKLKII